MISGHPDLRILALATGIIRPDDDFQGEPAWVYTPGSPENADPDEEYILPHYWRLYRNGEGSTFTIFGFTPGADHMVSGLTEALDHGDPETAGFQIVRDGWMVD